MPKRHGLNLNHEIPTIEFGILEISKAVGLYPFNPKVTVIPGIPGAASRYSNHFEQTAEKRMFYVLHSAQFHFNEYAKCLTDFTQKKNREKSTYHTYYASIAVESFFYYWNVLIDDLARIIPYAMESEPEIFGSKGIDGFRFSHLKKKILDGNVYPHLKHLFEQLPSDFSWWSLGFSFEKGFRHRFTHYPDSFNLNAEIDEHGLCTASPHVWQFNDQGLQVDADFDYLMFGTLKLFFEWLDKLEEALRIHLRSRAKSENITWRENVDVHRFKLLLDIENADRELRLLPQINP
jgi:hypothetical protein